MKNIIIVGGGASGMMSAITSAQAGNNVILFEKNEKLGKKIYITGKGRCNLSNDISVNDFFDNVVSNPKFLYSSINNFTPENTFEFFEKNGLKLKIERGNRVFPLSDKASDVTKTLEKILSINNVKIKLNENVSQLIIEQNMVKGIISNGIKYYCDSVIICTGGISYPSTGSTGDGYIFAKKCGHSVINPTPALCGIEIKDKDILSLQGLSLKNVRLNVYFGDKIIHQEFGEMLFTHFGISGPIVLTVSSYINRLNLNDLRFEIDLKPALDFDTLYNRIIREIEANQNKNFLSLLKLLEPSSLCDVLVNRIGISKERKCCLINKEEITKIIYTLKKFKLTPKCLRPVSEAIITAGGINTKEINPKTMESKIIKGLFFAGEVIDVDALTGGFNLQIAFSTGHCAGFFA